MGAQPIVARHVTWETTVHGARSDEDALVAAVSALFGRAHRMLRFTVMTESGPVADYSVDKEVVMNALGKEANK